MVIISIIDDEKLLSEYNNDIIVDYDIYIDQNYRDNLTPMPIRILYLDDHLYKKVYTRTIIYKRLRTKVRDTLKILKLLKEPVRDRIPERLESLTKIPRDYNLNNFDFYRNYMNLKRFEKHLIKYGHCLIVNISDYKRIYFRTRQTHSVEQTDGWELGFGLFSFFSITSATVYGRPMLVGESAGYLENMQRVEVSRMGMTIMFGYQAEVDEPKLTVFQKMYHTVIPNEKPQPEITTFAQFPIRPGKIFVITNKLINSINLLKSK
jgi:hypothetical protein